MLEGEKNLALYSITGALMLQQVLGKSQVGHQQLDVSHLPTGAYECILYIQGEKVQTTGINVVH